MTDEEFERLKEAEKQHLRQKKRMRRTLEALKRRNRTQGIVQTMKHGAQRLLEETESLVDTLRSQVARNEAQLEVAIDEEEFRGDDLHEAEEDLREERAESLIRQYKAASSPPSRPARDEQEGPNDESASPDPDQPEKTIGRMRPSQSDEAAS